VKFTVNIDFTIASLPKTTKQYNYHSGTRLHLCRHDTILISEILQQIRAELLSVWLEFVPKSYLFLSTVEGPGLNYLFLHDFIVEIEEMLTGNVDDQQLFEVIEL
jgi:hypothetical protein